MAVSPRRRRFQRILGFAVAGMAVVVVVLLGLVAGGVLSLSSSSGPTPITIESVVLEIQQGTTSSGVPWFGPSPITFTTGFPLNVNPGGNFSFVWLSFFNFDSMNHTIGAAHPSSPFVLASTWPTLPYKVPYDSEGHNLEFWLQVPSKGGGSYIPTVIVTTLTQG